MTNMHFKVSTLCELVIVTIVQDHPRIFLSIKTCSICLIRTMQQFVLGIFPSSLIVENSGRKNIYSYRLVFNVSFNYSQTLHDITPQIVLYYIDKRSISMHGFAFEFLFWKILGCLICLHRKSHLIEFLLTRKSQIRFAFSYVQ